MKKEDIIRKISTPEALIYVKKRLEAIQKLPATGVVGGQAVASAVIEFLELDNLITPTYNDIDVFVRVHKQTMENEENKEKFKRLVELHNARCNHTSNFTERETNISGYGNIFNHTYTTDRVYTSLNFNKLNKTYLLTEFSNVSGVAQAERTINNFDINATQVGFDIKESKRIHYTKNFIDFLYTRELRLSMFNTPHQSIIRLTKKADELGVYLNPEIQNFLVKSQAFLVQAQNRLRRYGSQKEISNYHKLDLPLNFGEKHKDTFIQHGMEEEYTLLKTDNGLYTLDIDRTAGEKFLDRFLSLHGSNLIQTEDKKIIISAFQEEYGDTPSDRSEGGIWGKDILNNIVSDFQPLSHARKGLSNIAGEFSFKTVLETPVLLNKTTFHECVIGENIDVLKRYARVYKKLLKHSGTLRSNIFKVANTIGEATTIAENIFKADKKDRVLVGHLENGEEKKVFENIGKCITIEGAFDFSSEILEHSSRKLKSEKLVFSTGHYSVTECSSGVELFHEARKQHHCVGGYADAVKSGRVNILSLSSKDKTKYPDITISLDSLKRKEKSIFEPYNISYDLSQAMMKFNKRAFLTPELFEVLQEIDKTYKILPLDKTFYIPFSGIDEALNAEVLFQEKKKRIFYKTKTYLRYKKYEIKKIIKNLLKGKIHIDDELAEIPF